MRKNCIWLKTSASIQKRASPLKFDHSLCKIPIFAVSNLSTKVLEGLCLHQHTRRQGRRWIRSACGWDDAPREAEQEQDASSFRGCGARRDSEFVDDPAHELGEEGTVSARPHQRFAEASHTYCSHQRNLFIDTSAASLMRGKNLTNPPPVLARGAWGAVAIIFLSSFKSVSTVYCYVVPDEEHNSFSPGYNILQYWFFHLFLHYRFVSSTKLKLTAIWSQFMFETKVMQSQIFQKLQQKGLRWKCERANKLTWVRIWISLQHFCLQSRNRALTLFYSKVSELATVVRRLVSSMAYSSAKRYSVYLCRTVFRLLLVLYWLVQPYVSLTSRLRSESLLFSASSSRSWSWSSWSNIFVCRVVSELRWLLTARCRD